MSSRSTNRHKSESSVTIQTNGSSTFSTASERSSESPRPVEHTVPNKKADKAMGIMTRETEKLMDLAEGLLCQPVREYAEQMKSKNTTGLGDAQLALGVELPLSLPIKNNKEGEIMCELRREVSRLIGLSETYMETPKMPEIGYIPEEDKAIEVTREVLFTNPDLDEIAQQVLTKIL